MQRIVPAAQLLVSVPGIQVCGGVPPVGLQGISVQLKRLLFVAGGVVNSSLAGDGLRRVGTEAGRRGEGL